MNADGFQLDEFGMVVLPVPGSGGAGGSGSSETASWITQTLMTVQHTQPRGQDLDALEEAYREVRALMRHQGDCPRQVQLKLEAISPSDCGRALVMHRSR